MEQNRFGDIMASLRREKGVSQRKAAGELGISQALLSHYENGSREPGLPFICRACDYYGVTADYLLGRVPDPGAVGPCPAECRELAARLRVIAERLEGLEA